MPAVALHNQVCHCNRGGEIIEVDDSEDEDGGANLCADLSFSDAAQMRETRARVLEVWLFRQRSRCTTRIAAFLRLSSKHANEEHRANGVGFPQGAKKW